MTPGTLTPEEQAMFAAMNDPNWPAEQLAKIQAHLQSGGSVQVSTHTRVTRYTRPKHTECFRVRGHELQFSTNFKRFYPLAAHGRYYCHVLFY